jgi:hypothetical protein
VTYRPMSYASGFHHNGTVTPRIVVKWAIRLYVNVSYVVELTTSKCYTLSRNGGSL